MPAAAIRPRRSACPSLIDRAQRSDGRRRHAAPRARRADWLLLELSRPAPVADLYYVTRPDRVRTVHRDAGQGLTTTCSELDPTIPADGSSSYFVATGPATICTSRRRMVPTRSIRPTAIGALNRRRTRCSRSSRSDATSLFSRGRTGGGDLYHVDAHRARRSRAPSLVTGLATAARRRAIRSSPPTVSRSTSAPIAPAALRRLQHLHRRRARGDLGHSAPRSSCRTSTPTAMTDPSWISPDGCRLYISSDVAGTNDIYVSTARSTVMAWRANVSTSCSSIAVSSRAASARARW